MWMNARRPIAVYGLSNTGGLAVYEIDTVEDRILVGLNDQEPEWYDLVYEPIEGEAEGFRYGELFIPVTELMRV